MIVIGIERKSGEYKGYAFDKLKIHCTTEIRNGQGQGVFSFTCPVGTQVSLGDDVRPLYNQYGKVVDVQVL